MQSQLSSGSAEERETKRGRRLMSLVDIDNDQHSSLAAAQRKCFYGHHSAQKGAVGWPRRNLSSLPDSLLVLLDPSVRRHEKLFAIRKTSTCCSEHIHYTCIHRLAFSQPSPPPPRLRFSSRARACRGRIRRVDRTAGTRERIALARSRLASTIARPSSPRVNHSICFSVSFHRPKTLRLRCSPYLDDRVGFLLSLGTLHARKARYSGPNGSVRRPCDRNVDLLHHPSRVLLSLALPDKHYGVGNPVSAADADYVLHALHTPAPFFSHPLPFASPLSPLCSSSSSSRRFLRRRVARSPHAHHVAPIRMRATAGPACARATAGPPLSCARGLASHRARKARHSQPFGRARHRAHKVRYTGPYERAGPSHSQSPLLWTARKRVRPSRLQDPLLGFFPPIEDVSAATLASLRQSRGSPLRLARSPRYPRKSIPQAPRSRQRLSTPSCSQGVLAPMFDAHAFCEVCDPDRRAINCRTPWKRGDYHACRTWQKLKAP
ncbi:hypothetical protein DFH11DRAFT_1796057 [Phellopilus nigrolimitatus]|nr:hypothetical protein DFH11DRAFT_1796057 [Phellopilus nigrolimitatus]